MNELLKKEIKPTNTRFSMHTDILLKVITSTVGVVSVAGGALLYPIDTNPMTLEELEGLAALYDYEIHLNDGMTISDAGNIMEEVHEQIRARDIEADEIVVISGEGLTEEEYEGVREGLLHKAEETDRVTNLYEIITN